jgi:hypothetical protein
VPVCKPLGYASVDPCIFSYGTQTLCSSGQLGWTKNVLLLSLKKLQSWNVKKEELFFISISLLNCRVLSSLNTRLISFGVSLSLRLSQITELVR